MEEIKQKAKDADTNDCGILFLPHDICLMEQVKPT